MPEKTQRSAIIIGASGGIGGAIAQRLAQDGFAVVAHYAGNPAKAESTVKAIASAGGRAIAVRADVASEADIDGLFKTALETFGSVDTVIIAAGIMPMARIEAGDVATFDRVVATNLRGSFIVLSRAARHVSPGGRIIAFSSSVLAKSFPGYGPYIASKAGVEGLVRVLANELRGRNITVNALAPGPTGTELFLTGKSDGIVEELAKMAPLERLGTPADIAAAVSFLAGPDGAWVNGQVVRVNGGFA